MLCSSRVVCCFVVGVLCCAAGGSRGSCESQEGRKRSSSLRRPSELTGKSVSLSHMHHLGLIII